MNVTQLKSCYEETFNPFTRVDEEFLFFIKNYVTEPNDPLGNLKTNMKIAKDNGKKEIAAIWGSVYSLVKEYLHPTGHQEQIQNFGDELTPNNKIQSNSNTASKQANKRGKSTQK